MVIGSLDGQGRTRSAQGPKSEAFHFTARMCAHCNGVKTQRADRAFVKFSELVAARLASGQNPASVFDLPQ